MPHTIIQFDLIKLEDGLYAADTRELYVFGFVDFYLLKEFLEGDDYLTNLGEGLGLEENDPKTITLQIWEDSDDYTGGPWIDYKVLPDDYEVKRP